MYRRQDRSGNHLPFIRGGRAGAGWHYGFDEPRLQNVGRVAPWEREQEPNIAIASPRRLVQPTKAASRNRLRVWLFDKGGMCVVLIVGLLVVAIVGSAVGRY